jgi:phage terminase small subunit
MKEQHKIFADTYIKTLNASESYRIAYPKCKSNGTARANGSKLLAKADIKSYIKERMESKDAERVADQDEILEFLTNVMRGNVKDQMGLETPVKERNRAAELLGKRHGLFVEKLDINEKIVVFGDEDKLED